MKVIVGCLLEIMFLEKNSFLPDPSDCLPVRQAGFGRRGPPQVHQRRHCETRLFPNKIRINKKALKSQRFNQISK